MSGHSIHVWWEIQPFRRRGLLRYRLVSVSDGSRPPHPGARSQVFWFRWSAQRAADKLNTLLSESYLYGRDHQGMP